VHTALLMGGPATIKEIAIEHGFVELGRFAGEYRRLFGELPSQTLRRASSLPGVLLGCYIAHWGWLADGSVLALQLPFFEM
jgi:AraC-like DNA-binding protein